MNSDQNLGRNLTAGKTMNAVNKSGEDILESALAKMDRARVACTPRLALREWRTNTGIGSGIANASAVSVEVCKQFVRHSL
jgi:hypothetical protein